MKRLLKHFLVHSLSLPPISMLGSLLFGHSIPIFMIHKIVPDNTPGKNNITPAYLQKCLTYLKSNGFSFVSAEDIVNYLRHDIVLPEKSVVFTIDDGFYDQANLSAPVFAEFNCPTTIFLISGMIDEGAWPWFDKVQYLIVNSKSNSITLNMHGKDETIALNNKKNRYLAGSKIRRYMKTIDSALFPEIIEELERLVGIKAPQTPPDEYKPMTWDQAREAEKMGIKFGPHTVTHPILSKVSKEQASYEISHSWQRLKDELSSPSPVFCYPNGTPNDFGEREIEIIKSCGLPGAVSTVPAYVNTMKSADHNIYSIPRLSLPGSYTDFIQLCTWIDRAKGLIRSANS
jgi:peptidoglycan/xylan/chitin deacetylase (PgdA/CDA1 family)